MRSRADGVFAGAATATRALGRLGLSVAVARAFGAESFGAYALLLVAEAVVLMVAASRAQAPLTTLAPGLRPGLAGALLRHLGGRLTRDLAAASLLFVLALPLLVEATGLPRGVLEAWGLATLVAALQRLGQGWRLATFRAGRVLVAEVCAALAPLTLCALIASEVWRPTGEPLVALYLALAAGQGAGLLVLFERPPRFALPSKVASEARELGATMLAGSCVYSASSRVQPFALGQLQGLLAVAPFAAALTLAGPLRVFSAAVDVVLRPRLAAAGSAERPRLLRRALGVQVLAALGALVTFALLGPWATEFLYGGVIPGLVPCAGLALLYVATESIGSTLTVASQVEGPAGARRATRVRCWVSGLSLVGVAPAVLLGGAQGALAQLVIVEACFAWVLGRSLTGAPASRGLSLSGPGGGTRGS